MLRALVIVFILTAAGFWLWAFSPWARGSHPDKLASVESMQFTVAAQKECNRVFPSGQWVKGRQIQNFKTPEQRGVFAKEANALMRGMFNELKKLAFNNLGVEADEIVLGATTTTKNLSEILSKEQKNLKEDRELVTKWLIDWLGYLNDRDTWAEKLAKGEDAPPLETARDGTRPLSRIEIFTRVNKMSGCSVPAFV